MRGHPDGAAPPTAVSATTQGEVVRSVGDLDGDGVPEVVARSNTSNTVRVHRWTALGPSLTPRVTFALPEGVSFGVSAVGTTL